MTCQHCGAALPPFALFCGECGRSVSAPAVAPPVVERPVAPVTAPLPVPVDSPDALPWSADGPLSIDSPAEPEPAAPTPVLPTAAPPSPAAFIPAAPIPAALIPAAPIPAALIPAAPTSPASAPARASALDGDAGRCAACGAVREPHDRYCAECGAPLPGDTRIIEPIVGGAAWPALPVEVVPDVAPDPQPDVQPDLQLDPGPESWPEPDAKPVPISAHAPAPAAAAAPALVPSPMPVPDVESTRIVPRGTGGARFVLQFSTGESYTVLGSGLAGRNPHPEPGEYVDHLVAIVDPGRSVSKTHFEFGQEAGVFWFSDRHSGNGSVIREPGAEPRPCEPGRRYPVVRGTRIDIGEQFVVVS